MSAAERRFFSAGNLERAVLEAAGHFGVDPERLRYERVDKRSGFTKRRRVVIRVDPSRVLLEPGEPSLAAAAEPSEVATEDTPIEAATNAAEAPRPAVPPAPPPRPRAEEREVAPAPAAPVASPLEPAVLRPFGERARPADADRWRGLPQSSAESLAAQPRPAPDVEAATQRWLGLLLDLADLDLRATIRQGVDRLEIGLEGADAEWLIEDEGEALQALQTLLPRLLDGDSEDAAVCRIDCNGFQELREERLRSRAHRAAAEVRRTRERVLLEPMMPADRRIVHLALVNDTSVTTESVGRGFFKRVTIRPT